MGSVLEPNINAQIILLVSLVLNLPLFACVRNSYSFPHSLQLGVPVPSSGSSKDSCSIQKTSQIPVCNAIL
jgi:hypothetical protein